MINDIIYREMTLDDVKAVSEIEKECFFAPWKPDDFVKMVEDDNSAYVVAEYNGVIIGGAGIRNIVGDGEITNVAITEKYRGKGYSKQLIYHLIEEGKKLGCTQFTLEVRVSNEPAIRCYKSAGFESEGVRPGFYEHPKEDALIMWIRNA